MMQWPKMCEILQPQEGERFEIVHSVITEKDLVLAKLRDVINGRREYYGQKPGAFAQLRDKWSNTLMMSDTWMEQHYNEYFVYKANGDVLIGGLGLGMVVLAIQDKPEVTSVTVIEIYQGVIDLVAPQLPLNDKVVIVKGDIFKWYPDKGKLYDVIFFDIWNAVCGDDYEETKTLHRRFARRLNRANPYCWMGSWRRHDVKRAHKQSFRW